jgi:nucleoside-diphosphate-sugar epimerase
MQKQAVTAASPTRPDSLYGLSKLLAERILEVLLNSEVVILRLFFPFGPGQRLPRLIPRLIQRIARGQSIEINTNFGYPIINPIFIDDLVDQLIQIMKGPGQTRYNLGGETCCSMRQLSESIANKLRVEPNFIVADRDVGNMMCKPDLHTISRGTFEEKLATTIKDTIL